MTFGEPPQTSAHWKLAGVDAYAADRPAAWVDDAFDQTCRVWARRREAPTVLVDSDPASGLTAEHAQVLRDWAREVAG